MTAWKYSIGLQYKFLPLAMEVIYNDERWHCYFSTEC